MPLRAAHSQLAGLLLRCPLWELPQIHWNSPLLLSEPKIFVTKAGARGIIYLPETFAKACIPLPSILYFLLHQRPHFTTTRSSPTPYRPDGRRHVVSCQLVGAASSLCKQEHEWRHSISPKETLSSTSLPLLFLLFLLIFSQIPLSGIPTSLAQAANSAGAWPLNCDCPFINRVWIWMGTHKPRFDCSSTSYPGMTFLTK